MRTLFRVFPLLCLISVLCVCSAAGAQGISRPGSTPTFSPYLNMLRQDSGPGQNYFGLVRPQLNFAQQNQQLSQGLNALQMQQNSMMPMSMMGMGYSQLGTTGHPVLFNSFGTSPFSGGYTGLSGGGMGNSMMTGGMMGGGMGMMGQGMMGGGFGGNMSGNGFGGGSSLNSAGAGTLPGGGGFSPAAGMQGSAMSGANMMGFGSMTGHSPQFGGIGSFGSSGQRR